MKNNIKAIIEDYIEYIENGDWDILFKKWYKDVASKPEHRIRPEWSEILTGDETIKEFFSALEEAGIYDIERLTLDIRKNIIKDEAEKVINKLTSVPPYNKNNELYFIGFKTHMNTFLGLKESYVRKIFSEICIQKGMTPLKPNIKSAYKK